MLMVPHSNVGHFVEYSAAQDAQADCPLDMQAVIKTGNLPRMRENKQDIAQALLKTDWLPFAAEYYNISSNLKDFVIVATTIFLTEIPNSNFCAFPFHELTAWNPEAGRVAFRSWAKKPCFLEHANSDPTQAKGVIFDASLKPVSNYVGGLHRMVLLAGWDRSRYPELVNKIAAGRSGFSMGGFLRDQECSVCGHSMREGECAHIAKNGQIKVPHVGNKLTYRIAKGITGFELSSVAVPAWRSAVAEPIG